MSIEYAVDPQLSLDHRFLGTVFGSNRSFREASTSGFPRAVGFPVCS
jgi:hypothetical protein